MIDERIKAKIAQLEEGLRKEGYEKKTITAHSETGFGDMDSFFEFLLEQKLDGNELPSLENVWENMKKQINFYRFQLNKASADYLKLENRLRTLQKTLQERIKE